MKMAELLSLNVSPHVLSLESPEFMIQHSLSLCNTLNP